MNTDDIREETERHALPEARVTPEQLRAAQRVAERQMQVMRAQMARQSAATELRQRTASGERPSSR